MLADIHLARRTGTVVVFMLALPARGEQDGSRTTSARWVRHFPQPQPGLIGAHAAGTAVSYTWGNTFQRRPGGRPILIAYEAGCSEPSQTCFATSAAKHAALLSVRIGSADMRLAARLAEHRVTAASALLGGAA